MDNCKCDNVEKFVGFEVNIQAANEDEEKLLKIFVEAFQLRRKKGADYGDVWKDLGTKKEFVYLYDKVMRLKTLIWDGNKPANESTRDSVIDLINYSFHTAILLDEELALLKNEEVKEIEDVKN